MFDRWVLEHRGIIVKVARAYAVTEGEMAEVEQEMMVRLWDSTAGFGGEAKASTWVYRVCLNTALMWRRGKTRREVRIDPEADVLRISADRANPAEDAGKRDLLEQLYGAIHALPDFDRALVLLMLDGLAYREIADVTGLTENHVGVALMRARKRLLERMKGLRDELE